VEYRLEDFVNEKSAAWVKSLDQRLMDTGQPVVNEVSLFGFLNGTKHWLQLSTVAVHNAEGTPVGLLSVARDISDLKYTESELRSAIAKAEKASRAKGDFLAAMSHEIRTPINGIIGASELCQETSLDLEQRNYMDTVIQCSTTLLHLVNDVLDYSKIEAGQLNLEVLNFSPLNLIESIAEEFAQSARAKMIELIVSVDPEIPDFVMGDPTRLKQVFYNLLGNAIKFTDRGEITIRAKVVERGTQTTQLQFSVSDTGIGISPDRQKAIFKSFSQADMSTTRRYGGTGLGLSICLELVHLMGGDISVESEIDQGARFVFQLPFQISDHPGAEAVPYNAELVGLRVLIVDDNQTNRELYEQMCAGWGYRSSLAKDGITGLTELEKGVREGDPFRLVLLDQQMPALSGLDLAGLIRSRPDLRKTQIILLSSSISYEDSKRAEELNLARALAKPVRRAVLQEVILETFGVRGPKEPVTDVSSAPSELTNKSLNVLVVDDNPINRDLAMRRLKKLGHRSTPQAGGLEALEAAKSERFDCILMDIQMPDMDGYEATQAIRDYEETEGLPPSYIVAMTAHAMKGDRERCLSAGFDNYIPKPFRGVDLKTALAGAAEHVLSFARTPPIEEIDPGGLAACLDDMDEEDREDVIAAAPMFLSTIREEIEQLNEAVRKVDFDRCAFLAHGIKGVTGIFRSQRCKVLAEMIESEAKKSNIEAIKTATSALIEALNALIEELEAIDASSN
jgi:signal transduction histidine kinase/DNA-binding response OmpR family regulator